MDAVRGVRKANATERYNTKGAKSIRVDVLNLCIPHEDGFALANCAAIALE